MAKTQAIQPGYCAAVHLMPGTAPDSCYIGMVEVSDDHGILLNLIHWDDKLDMLGGYTESLFIPWVNINSVLISTEKQPTRRFMADRARKWKAQIDTVHGKEPAAAKKNSK
jgi:hypothetical protein